MDKSHRADRRQPGSRGAHRDLLPEPPRPPRFGAVAQKVDRQRQGVVVVHGGNIKPRTLIEPESLLLAPSPAAAHLAVAA